MRKKMKNFLSILLSAMLITSCIPTMAFAENDTMPPLPEATVTEVEKEDYTFAFNVNMAEPDYEQNVHYMGWYADYEITFNKDVCFNSTGESDGYLSCMDQLWDGISVTANETLKIVELGKALTGGTSSQTTYQELYYAFNPFNMGIFFTDEFLSANPDLKVTVELKIYNPENLDENYVLAKYGYPLSVDLPTATVTKIYKDDLTFAMNFKADEVTEEQLAYYGDWYADFEIKANTDLVLNADGIENGTADGYLSGNYAEYGWVNVPITELNVTAGTPIKIMETAATTMGEPGLQYTFKEVYEVVKDFDCGIFLTDKFLAENPDFEVTLELKLYQEKDDVEGFTIGEKYTFKAEETELPTATVTKIFKEDLTFALNFKANEPTEAQLAKYGEWFADFELKANKDIVLNAAGVEDGTADGYLSGEYGDYGWINVPIENMTLTAGNVIKIMETAAETKGEPGLKYTYKEVYEVVKNFNCGVFLTDEFLAANPDLKITLELKLYNPNDETKGYIIGSTHVFTAKEATLPTATVTEIEKEDLTFALNFKADEVTAEQLEEYGKWYADFEIKSNKDIVLHADYENENADGYLSGQYDGWEFPGFDSKDWVNVPFNESVTLKANEPLKIMEFAAEAMGEPGLKYTYKEVYEVVKDFNCGIFLTEEFLADNQDIELTLELKLYNPANEKEAYLIGETHEFEIPELPTATATRIHNKDLTFAMNFKTEELSDAQIKYYEKWFADFELTVNKDVTLHAEYDKNNADGFLSGQYDAWNENWVNVPFNEAVTLKAGDTIKVMEYASELMGEPGLKYTFGEVYTGVQDFDCGMFFTEEFLAENPDLKVTLELKMYNPVDETKAYTIGETYVFTLDEVMPALPTATVSDIVSPENPDLTFAKNFKVDDVTTEQLEYYDDWYADFEITINKDVTLNADYENEGADGYLSGQYDGWDPDSDRDDNWYNVPFNESVTLKANQTIKIMEFASELLGEKGLKYTFKEVYENVKDFDCGAFFTPEFLKANPDLKVTLELRMYNPADESESYLIGETYIFTTDAVAMNVQTGNVYTDVTDGLFDAKTGQRVVLLKDVKATTVTVPADVTLDLDGYKLTAKYFSCFGDTVDYSGDNSGVLVFPEKGILMQEDNKQLPVKGTEGYQFFEIVKINSAKVNATKYAFQPLFEGNAVSLLSKGKDNSGVTVKVQVSWEGENGKRVQNFEYSDKLVNDFLDTYKVNEDKYTGMFALTLKNTNSITGFTFKTVIESDTGVMFSTNEL